MPDSKYPVGPGAGDVAAAAPLQLPRPMTFAIQREIWGADGWERERETIFADQIHQFGEVLIFTNTQDGETLIVSGDALIAAWTEGVRSH